jgi:hypothetical protein
MTSLIKLVDTFVKSIRLDTHDWEDWPDDSRIAFANLLRAIEFSKFDAPTQPSPAESRLYYEAHVTIDPVPEDQRGALQDLATPLKFKLAKLLMQKGEPSTLDTFLTGHSKVLDEIKANTKKMILALKAEGYVVRRFKIEDTLIDSRHGDTLGDL